MLSLYHILITFQFILKKYIKILNKIVLENHVNSKLLCLRPACVFKLSIQWRRNVCSSKTKSKCLLCVLELNELNKQRLLYIYIYN